MYIKTIGYIFFGIVIGAVITYFLILPFRGTTVNAMMGMMGIRNNETFSSNSRSLDIMDQHFIEQMIPHHEDAISMAKVAMEKAKHPEIKTLAQNIITAQNKENTQMKAWYLEWFGQDVPQGDTQMGAHGMMSQGGMHMGMMGNETDLESLKNAKEFDQEFIKQMIPHHQMAIMMATMLASGTKREEMKQLTRNIISSQTSEIDDMRTWYRQWYE